MRALWTNDIHLEFLDEGQLGRFLNDLKKHRFDCMLAGGDIAQAPSLTHYLSRLEAELQRPIYFVLGNHDYYYGSITAVRSSVSELVKRSHNLCWLNEAGIVQLTETTALIGHDGWGDGRLGDFHNSDVQLNDFLLIEELVDIPQEPLLRQLHALGDEAAEHFRTVLPEALRVSNHMVVLTHVPPFLEAAWYDGRYCDPDWLPFFSCKAVGEVLKQAMRTHPKKSMTVLCGHTHGGGVSQVLPNLVSYTGPATYGSPTIQRIFEWD
jgi:predicted MPP superfamily phosphohydrolase